MVSKNLIGDKYDKYRRFTYLFPLETASNDEKSSFVRYLIPLRLWNWRQKEDIKDRKYTPKDIL